MAHTSRSFVRAGRLDVRVPPENKRIIERAADICGTTLTDFVLNNAHVAAVKVIQEYDTLRLRDEDRDVFFQALLNPPEPSAHAKAAVARYKEQVRD
jgi:uncharacterized protein (DUF1778 family)